MPRVLILRKPDSAVQLRAALEAEGYSSAALPVTATEFLLPANFVGVTTPWIAFTSANGARGLYRALVHAAHVLQPSVRIACVGQATADVAHALFARKPDHVAPVADGAHLALSLSKSLPAGTDILYPCPGGHDSDFTTTCRELGLNVQALPVYRTLMLDPQELQTALAPLLPCEYAVFYAPSAVRAFCLAHPLPWPFTAVAIGPTTHRALITMGQRNTILSEQPRAEAIVNAIRFADSNAWEPEHV